ncbi:MAG: hypothetical protein PHW27_04955 [Melioribacteraceae bacterium]|nr:hypothetical protein [Melioribacteraceae bacterium]
MNTKIQLRHPDGKKAITMNQAKYDVIKEALISHLKSNGASTHTEILKSITDNFKKNEMKFDGSIEWHMEWVKLDLEARKIINRIADKSPIKFELT